MDHVAIMKKSWGLTAKIVSGEKTIETRWYLNRSAPWDKIHTGDTIYFKDSGFPITVQAEVSKVEQFSGLTPAKTKKVLSQYSQRDLGTTGVPPQQIQSYMEGKKYCIIIHLKNPQRVPPFDISKKGFGLMSAWICIDDIQKIII